MNKWFAAVPVAVVGVLAAQSARATVAEASTSSPAVVANWAMNDGSDGVMTDSSSFNNDGRLDNVATGQSYGFPLSSSQPSRVVVPNDASLNPDDTTFVVSLHVNFDAWPSSRVGDYDLIRKGQSADGRDWKVEVMQDGRGRCYAKGATGGKSLLSAKPLAKGSWHTIVCTFTTKALTVAVDGGTPKTARGSIGTVANSAVLSIGSKYGGSDDGGDQYTGRMENVTITKG